MDDTTMEMMHGRLQTVQTVHDAYDAYDTRDFGSACITGTVTAHTHIRMVLCQIMTSQSF